MAKKEQICNECEEKEIREGETYSYKGWMNSDSILKRALGVFSYYILGSIILFIPLMIIFLIIVLFAIATIGK